MTSSTGRNPVRASTAREPALSSVVSARSTVSPYSWTAVTQSRRTAQVASPRPAAFSPIR
ncbi:hypothetical protein SMICM17S_00704 [Streptomyces microflavus]